MLAVLSPRDADRLIAATESGQQIAPEPAEIVSGRTLRANIDETVLPVIITEQGENRNQCEEQRNLFGFSFGLACRGT
jgi:hypothetical protein